MEKKTKHTPAPWYIMSAKQMSVPYIVHIGDDTIFHCYNTFEEEDAKANALLIASAPEMLQMLKGLLIDIEAGVEINTDELKELIKKATGDE